MNTSFVITGVAAALGAGLLHRVWRRLQLSRAKHPSLTGHARISRRLANLLPYYGFDEDRFFVSDGAPPDVATRRRAGFERLAETFRARAPDSIALSSELEGYLSDALFTDTYRVPFPYREYVRAHLRIGSMAAESRDSMLRDLDGNWSYDLAGSYGLNLFGYDFYKRCLADGAAKAAALGPVLGPLHPLIAENARRLREISGLEEISFHMSGTEAVMQAVRLAQFHTRRSHIVLFSGAYHGWWDGVQPGVGNRRRIRDVYTLAEMSAATLRVLESRDDIACVLVNPLQALHPNAAAPSDTALVDAGRRASFDKAGYTQWLEALRDVCTRRGIVLIFDEVFLGFRLARGGAQEYFGVRADLVTYGKTLGGGLPVGVLCGNRRHMKRFRDDRPSDVCLARGTFNSHPFVIGAMNAFLRRLEEPEIEATYVDLDARWDARARLLNERLAAAALPVRVANMVSVWTVVYTSPSRYNWMLQYYLRSEGLSLSWVGTGRFIFSHTLTDSDFSAIADRFVRAASSMAADGWWWTPEGVTNRDVRRQLLRELIRAKFRGRSPATPPSISA